MVEYFLERGEISLKDLGDIILKGILNIFKIIDILKNGVKYEF